MCVAEFLRSKLILRVMVSGGVALGVSRIRGGHVGGAPEMGLVPSVTFFCPLAVRGGYKTAKTAVGRRPTWGPDHAAILVTELQPPEP